MTLAQPARATAVHPPGPDNELVDDEAWTSTPRWVRLLVLAAIIAVAVSVRIPFLHIETLDYQAFLSRWYDTLDTGGFGAFRERFADYNYPYLYLIWLLTALNIPALIGIKAISILFDLVLGFFAYRIVALRTTRFWLRALAFGIVVLLPSVIANSAWWGQADAVYSAFVLGGVYFLMRAQRESVRANSVWACVMFGLAISFKLQAIFVLPVLAWLLLRRRLPWYSLFAIPLVFLLLDLPAVLAGASLDTALSVYLDQTGSYKQLTLGAANLYQLIPIDGDATWLAHLGIVAAAALIVVFLVWSVWRKPVVTPTSILVVATASAVVVPFLLPAMHDRYFYTAEVLSVVMAFYLPLRFVLIPILIQAAAIGVYHSSLTGDQGRLIGGPGGGGRPGGGAGSGGGPGGSGGPGLADGGQHGPPGGGGGGGAGGYTSGRGDTALAVYASFMAAAVLGVCYTVADTVRRTRSQPPTS
ncbi:hypothetical protein [Gordonia rhizosphera]|uniref:Glycosyltransferase RgtA/B/C/D-like domain-containing protein n=1 Tax=Gordonia rhizosphera NBRC 16068 TaxID=1108045 RepID=K6WDQ3_9ACTN|nr:hypothetical protein [Gordonia rhizosphera]GAB90287.1 hypothetical protein GORHZ_092_00360 [Gordonia rhizosphera NBRC 16068]